MKRPLILIVNDDGITAPGIKALKEVAEKIGDIIIVAPDSPQSGMGHAITLNKPLRLHESKVFNNTRAYECSGTPVDCVKIAVNKILKRKPDLCISGINHGSNSSINIIYSGTMSAAVEAALEDIPSIGFSLLDYNWEANFSEAKKYVEIIIKQVLDNKLEKNTLLNVNIPAKSDEPIKGIKICKQAKANWEEKFDERKDPFDRPYYWLTGEFVNKDKSEDTDEWALENNYVSIVPVQYDLTSYKGIDFINKNWKV